MIRLCAKPLWFSALAAALALGLAGCGVKGPLEPPPSAGVAPVPQPAPANTAVAPPPTLAPIPGAPATVTPQPAASRLSPGVVNAPAAQQRSVLDWLVD